MRENSAECQCHRVTNVIRAGALLILFGAIKRLVLTLGGLDPRMMLGEKAFDVRPEFLQNIVLRYGTEAGGNILQGAGDRFIAIRQIRISESRLCQLAENE